MKKLRYAIFVCLAGVLRVSAQTAPEIFDDSWLFSPSDHMVLNLTMVIHEAQGEKSRGLQVLLVQNGVTNKMLAKVTSPASLSNLKFLRITPQDGKNQLWVKTSRGVRRIATGGGSGEQLFGSDFTLDDFAVNRSTGIQVERIPDLETESTWVLRVRPNNPDGVVRVMTVERASKLVARVEFHEAGGRLLRLYHVDEWGDKGGITYPKQAMMEDLVKKTWTRLEIQSVDMVSPLSEAQFNAAGL